MPLKPCQAWGIDHLSRKPVVVFDHALGKETIHNVHSDPPLVQLWTSPMSPVTGTITWYKDAVGKGIHYSELKLDPRVFFVFKNLLELAS